MDECLVREMDGWMKQVQNGGIAGWLDGGWMGGRLSG